MMYIAHVGDSRLYLIRDLQIKKITTDHSYIEELVKNGSLTREEANRHPQKNIITRALGLPGDIEVDKYQLQLEKDDCLIMCTDGLTNMISEEDMSRIAVGNGPDDACRKLVEAANDNGGEDNITVIVMKI
jgi:protein phosphatase